MSVTHYRVWLFWGVNIGVIVFGVNCSVGVSVVVLRYMCFCSVMWCMFCGICVTVLWCTCDCFGGV